VDRLPSANTFATTGSDAGSNTGAGDNDHHHTTGGRMQVILRTELGQLVVQMYMALLCRVSFMHGNNNHHDYSCSKTTHLQEIVRGKSEDEALE